MLLAFCACRRAPVEAKRDPTPVGSITATVASPPKVPADLRIVLLRTMCHGQCPAYAVVVDASGHVTFIGQAFVMTARAEVTISAGQVGELVAAIEAYDFFELGDVNQNWKDCTKSRTTITLGGKTKTVRDGCVGAEDGAGPDTEALEKLGNEIDRIASTDRWIGPESKRERLFDEPDAATAKTTPELDYWQ